MTYVPTTCALEEPGTQPHILFEHLGDRALLLLKLVLLQRRVCRREAPVTDACARRADGALYLTVVPCRYWCMAARRIGSALPSWACYRFCQVRDASYRTESFLPAVLRRDRRPIIAR